MESTVLVKAFAILETLASLREPTSLADLTERLSFNKPTIHRILQDLVGLGYVERVGGGVYCLSNKLQRLTQDQAGARLIELGETLLADLHESTQETTNLGVLQQDRVSYLTVLESPHPLRRVVGPGTMDPFYSTALGRAIVSHLPEEQWSRMLRGIRLKPQTPNTITDREVLLQTLATAKKQGYADEWEENDVGVMCVAVPILVRGEPRAAVSLTVPIARIDRNRERALVGQLKRTAEKFAAALEAD